MGAPREDEPGDVFERAYRRARYSAERRKAKVVGQAGESVWRTVGRVLYVTLAVIVDGPVLLEIVRVMDRSLAGWLAYAAALAVAVTVQVIAYKRWFDVDTPEFE